MSAGRVTPPLPNPNPKCGTCGLVLDATESCGKLIGCEWPKCNAVFCSGDCVEAHEANHRELRRGEHNGAR